MVSFLPSKGNLKKGNYWNDSVVICYWDEKGAIHTPLNYSFSLESEKVSSQAPTITWFAWRLHVSYYVIIYSEAAHFFKRKTNSGLSEIWVITICSRQIRRGSDHHLSYYLWDLLLQQWIPPCLLALSFMAWKTPLPLHVILAGFPPG